MKTEKEKDIEAWEAYKRFPTPENRSALLRRFDGLIAGQVNRWAGNIPRSVLTSRANVLAAKAFDTYDPSKGTALSTHITNNLQPLSRTVYTYQNAARIPENLTTRINAYNAAVNDFKLLNGREPTTEETSDVLGWKPAEVTKLRDYNVRDLLESGDTVSGSFYNNKEMFDDLDNSALAGIYFELDPTDKRVFEYVTGYNGAPELRDKDICARLGLTQSQLSYRKKNIRGKITKFMSRPSMRKRYGG